MDEVATLANRVTRAAGAGSRVLGGWVAQENVEVAEECMGSGLRA